MMVNNKNKVIGLINNDLPTKATYIIKLWKKEKKKKVTNLVILDEMLKSSSKKYDEMINLLKCGFGFMFSNPSLRF